ncbi:hypothetical protein [Janibacter melonis]|uniref:hypothetical protein n=1 Tax=Janibacter melonis TaxID=262209 RepID=UPI00174C3D33|nr:hypothetical protein [Janibacter melonis]
MTVPITHHAVVEVDDAGLAQLAKFRPVTDEDREEAFIWRVECSDPARCEGWQECGEDHPDAPDDPDETGGDESVTLHGVEHTWHTLHGWVLRMDGCPVEANAGTWCDPPEGMPLDRPGRYLIEADWDDTDLYLLLVDAEAGDPA